MQLHVTNMQDSSVHVITVTIYKCMETGQSRMDSQATALFGCDVSATKIASAPASEGSQQPQQNRMVRIAFEKQACQP